jgi:CHAT domain-containing protein
VADWRQQAVGLRDPAGPGAALARLVWRPLEEHLGGARTVLLAPDGELCALPFAALPGRKPGSFLLEQYAFGHVGSGRELLALARPGERDRYAAGLLALGGLDYGTPRPTAGAADPPPLEPLPGTRLEAERLAALFGRRFPGERAQLLHKADKAELRRALSGTRAWRWLHLATHGYFEPPPPGTPPAAVAALALGAAAAPAAAGRLQALTALLAAEEPGAAAGDRPGLDFSGRAERTWGRNPLLACGLALAGANARPEQGLLSAEEVASLDLRGCELAVLSACETGLGKGAAGEGLLGLQRAFAAAGARAVVVSLWRVSDPATSVLMEEFYAHLWGNERLPPLECLRRAQLAVLRQPERVAARAKELQALAAKRGLAAGELRGLKGRLPRPLPGGGRLHAPARRSPVAWWAGFVFAGDPALPRLDARTREKR